MVQEEKITEQLLENPFAHLVSEQTITTLEEFELENKTILKKVPVAYKTWGQLNESKDNVMVICHALTGSADISDWWGQLLGIGKIFDPSQYFIFCGNVLGSPYGTASPCTLNSETNQFYGPEFPNTTIRDDVRLHNTILKQLGVKQVAICIGGSLGGMQVLEWAMLGKEYVKAIVAIATCGKHSGWGISWGEAQRQAIYSDPKYLNGYYPFNDPPKSGLSAARMSALLTYRTRNSFELRFGRKRRENKVEEKEVFSAQSYLRYQGDKFVNRFDANCYIHLTKKMDTHDLGYNRGEYTETLKSIEQPSLIIGIESDGLFTISEQYELAQYLPNSEMKQIESIDGHDGFLLEFEQLSVLIQEFIKQKLPQMKVNKCILEAHQRQTIVKNSLFGEVEDTDLVEW
ncbi:homoserine O-acetyltransferase [Neoconidiobolus thromboides FSU 785]|nr:homoserine O-acetyltransferase [Neoconidiobolus thromboides FSU 785]